MFADVRVARLIDREIEGHLAVDKQEWTWGSRFNRKSKRGTEVKERWRISMLSGEYDEGLFSAGDLENLHKGLFTYRGDRFRVEWLGGAEAESVYGEFANWD